MTKWRCRVGELRGEQNKPYGICMIEEIISRSALITGRVFDAMALTQVLYR